MIEHKELGLKIAESPEEELIHKTIENAEKTLIALKLQIKLEENSLKFLKSLKR